jgi:hypothetical protein
MVTSALLWEAMHWFGVVVMMSLRATVLVNCGRSSRGGSSKSFLSSALVKMCELIH